MAKEPSHDTNFKDFQSPHEASMDRLVEAVDRAYHRPGLMIWRSFLHGFMTAVGASVGTVVVVIAYAALFRALGGFDLLQPYVEKLQNTITEVQEKSTSTMQDRLPTYQNATPTPE